MSGNRKKGVTIPTELKIKPGPVVRTLTQFLVDRIARGRFSGIVLGISGGVDSALSATLAVKALGPKRVTGIFMPYAESDPQSAGDADLLARKLKFALVRQPLTPFADHLFAAIGTRNKVRKGNVLARLRMIILFDHSHKSGQLVLGTSNKTEIMLGYGTWYGDTACSLNAIGDLYKSQVWQLAKYVGVPKRIIEKPPSADLWPGQTDEDELGLSYEVADKILFRMYERKLAVRQITAEGFEPKLVRRVRKLVEANRFKSRTPEIARLDGAA